MLKQVKNTRDKNGRLLPGNTANPNGRPKKEWTWRQLVIDSLEEVDNDGLEYKKVAVNKLREKAAGGDIAALKEIGDRVDGKAPQGIGSYGDDGEFKEQNIGVVFVSNDKS